jgi:FkbM family methyltransferase
MGSNIINRVLALGGVRLQRISRTVDPTEKVFDFLLRHQCEPKLVIDVGANHGNWSRRAHRYFPKASIIMIEPQEHLRADSADLLANPRITWITAGASNVVGAAKLTLAPIDHSSTFVFTEQQAMAEGLQQIEVPLVTLNQVIAQRDMKVPDVVKIDAEGLDLQVLEGASHLVGVTELFFMEAAICAQGIENTLLSVVTKMDELGYQPFDVTELNYSPKQGVLWLVEIAFVKKGGRVASVIGASY